MKRLLILGSGDAFATGGKHTTSFLLEGGDQGFLIDCGVSTLVRLKQINYDISRIRGIYLTHFHGDHFGGVPFIILTLKIELDHQGDFFIYGPKGVRDHVVKLQEAMYPGTGVYIDELGINFIEYGTGWMSSGAMEVHAFPVTHSPLSKPHGLKFRWNEQMLAFTGDTAWDDSLLALAEDTKLFITECNNLTTESPGHLSLSTLIERRGQLKTERMLLSHMGKEVLEMKRCPFERLHDGMEITLW